MHHCVFQMKLNCDALEIHRTAVASSDVCIENASSMFVISLFAARSSNTFPSRLNSARDAKKKCQESWWSEMFLINLCKFQDDDDKLCFVFFNRQLDPNFSYPFRWYFRKIKRIEAEKKLLLPENEHGAFLIRDSESRHNDYSLSGKLCCAF